MPAQLQADESRGGGAEAGPPTPPSCPLPLPRKTGGSTLPDATSTIHVVLKIRGGPTQGLPEVAFVLTKTSLQCAELGRWPWAQSRDQRKSPVATARQ